MMPGPAESLGLTGRVTALLCDLLHERLGLTYHARQFDQVADRLAPLVAARGFQSFMDYYYLLKYEDAPDEWLCVMDALAVPETYFWREIDQLRAVVQVLVPALAASRRGGPLRFWSVPCASGEEPLTLAMLLEADGWFDRVPIEILGSDASPAAIARAREGRYGERAFRSLPPDLRDRHFVQAGRGVWRVSDTLRARVSYDVVNLVDVEAVARHGPVSVVFCRNVFIYFSEGAVRRALDGLSRALTRPGYLCLATAESLLRLSTPFELQEIGGAFVYVLGAPPRDPARAVAATTGTRTGRT
jgi:chemotaxis protein methyltransferase CheR